MNKKIKKVIAFLLVMGLITGTPHFYAAAASPKLNKKSATVTIGNTLELYVKNTSKTVKWSSSNKAVAKVDSDGEVTAKKAGKAKITAKVGKKKYKCNVTVPKQYISSKSVFIQKGSKQKLNVYGVSKSDSLFWGSDYENIATVTQTGEITANSLGETTVYAVLNNGNGKMYECQVVVYDRTNSGDIVTASPRPTWAPEPTGTPKATSTPGGRSVTSVKISDKTVQVAVSKQKVLKATVLPESAVNKRVTWNSANTDVAKVGSDGTVTGVSAGKTVVYVTTADGEFIAVCNVIVSGTPATPKPSPSATPVPSPTAVPTPRPSIVPVNKVTLSSKALELNAGDSRTLTAAVLPADATEKSVMWHSGNDSVVRVDSSGKVTAVGAGATVILVTTMDGEFSAICTVRVTGNAAVPTTPPSPTGSSEPTDPTDPQEPTASPSSSPAVFTKTEIQASGEGSFADRASKFKDEFVKPAGNPAFTINENSAWWVKIPYSTGSPKLGNVSSVKLGDEVLRKDNIRVGVDNNNFAEAPEYRTAEDGIYISLVFIALHDTGSNGEMKFTITASDGTESEAVLGIAHLDNSLLCTKITRQADTQSTVELVSSSTVQTPDTQIPVSDNLVQDTNGIASCTVRLLSGSQDTSQWMHMICLTFNHPSDYYFVKKTVDLGETTYAFTPPENATTKELGIYPSRTAATTHYTVASTERHSSAAIKIVTTLPTASAALSLRNIGRR